MSNQTVKYCDHCNTMIDEETQFLEMSVAEGPSNIYDEIDYMLLHLHSKCLNAMEPLELLKVVNVTVKEFNQD